MAKMIMLHVAGYCKLDHWGDTPTNLVCISYTKEFCEKRFCWSHVNTFLCAWRYAFLSEKQLPRLVPGHNLVHLLPSAHSCSLQLQNDA